MAKLDMSCKVVKKRQVTASSPQLCSVLLHKVSFVRSLDTPTNLVYKNIHKKLLFWFLTLRDESRFVGKRLANIMSPSSSPSTSSLSRIIVEAGCTIRLGGGVVGAASDQVYIISLRLQRLVERLSRGWVRGCAGVHV